MDSSKEYLFVQDDFRLSALLRTMLQEICEASNCFIEYYKLEKEVSFQYVT